jgi:hypothetical protein
VCGHATDLRARGTDPARDDRHLSAGDAIRTANGANSDVGIDDVTIS